MNSVSLHYKYTCSGATRSACSACSALVHTCGLLQIPRMLYGSKKFVLKLYEVSHVWITFQLVDIYVSV